MSSSSSRSYNRNQYQFPDVANMTHCNCRPPYPLPVKVSWSQKNPGRRYKACPANICKVYGFLDPELPSQYYKDLFWREHEEKNALINQQGSFVANSEDSIQQLIAMFEKEMKEVKAKTKVHEIIMLMLGLVVVILFFVLCLLE